jgi:hypothetical protein
VEAAHDIAAHLSNLEHLAQPVDVARDEVQEGQPLPGLGLLVAELHDLEVALAQRLNACAACTNMAAAAAAAAAAEAAAEAVT